MIPAKSKYTIVKRSNSLFHIQTEKHDSKELTPYIIREAKKCGQLILSGKGLGTVPSEIWTLCNFYQRKPETYDDRGDYITIEALCEFVPLTVLDLSSNVLHEISPEIGNLKDLTILNLQDNNLEKLPDEIGSLEKLTELNLRHNKLTTLPVSLYSLKKLRLLSVSHNSLEIMDEALGNLDIMEFLDLSYNSLLRIPDTTGNLIRLTYLNVARNNLIDVCSDLSRLKVLRNLNFSHNKLITFAPPGDLLQLEKLYLQGNLLMSVPNLEGCFSLKELHLSFNRISDVTVEALETLTSLKVLLLCNNAINRLPKEIGMLKNLNWLDLSNNNLMEVPETIGHLPDLQILQLEGNPLKGISEAMMQRGSAALLRHLRSKAESMPQFQNSVEERVSDIYPDKISMLKNHTLDLSNKGLSDVIPASIFQDAAELNVAVVNLFKNLLDFVPDELILVSEELKEIDFSYNLMSTISPKISQCVNLQYLNLQKNLLYDLPIELGALKYLKELVISYNRFCFIPECVFELQRLEILLARGNHLTEINICGLSRLTKMSILDFTDNDIDHIPLELGNLKQIRSIGLRGNKFRQPRHAVLEKGTEYILSYLRDRIPDI